MSKEPIELLKHIADECKYLLSVNKALTKDNFLDDETLKRAVVRSLEIIGEATKQIPEVIKPKQLNRFAKCARFITPLVLWRL